MATVFPKTNWLWLALPVVGCGGPYDQSMDAKQPVFDAPNHPDVIAMCSGGKRLGQNSTPLPYRAKATVITTS